MVGKTTEPCEDEVKVIRAGQLVDSLAHAIRRGETGLANVPGLIKAVLEEGSWKERRIRTKKTVKFDRFIDFITAKPLEGLGEEPAAIKRLISNDPATLAAFETAIREGAQGKRNDIVDNVNEVEGRPTGNSKAYTLKRLKKERPDLFEEVTAGNMSANQAAIKAGFRRTKTPLEAIESLVVKLTPAELRHLMVILQQKLSSK